MSLPQGFKILLRRAGSIISVAGVVFVGLRLHEYGGEIDFSRIELAGWFVIALLALLYGIANLMLAFAWRNLLAQFGAYVTRTWAFRIYGISQIAKYVPGNIFHLAGRQTMGMSAGVAAMPLLKSTAWELGLIAAACGLFGMLAFPALFPAVSINTAAFLFFSLFVFTGGCLFHLAPSLGRAFCWYMLFLTASGLIFICLLYLLADITVPWSFLCGSYVLAWLAGLVTPGAPAGVGVRELVLLFLLKGTVSEADLIFVILMGRVVTVAGDFLFYLASLINRKTKGLLS